MALIKSKIILWIVIVVAAVLIVVFLTGEKPVVVRAQPIKPDELRVIVNATTTSTVKSETEVTLSAQRTGRVVVLPVQEGDIVKKGNLIARLDLTEEEVQTESTLAQSKATYEESQKNLNRIRDLFEKGMIAQQDLDVASRAYEVARSQYDAAKGDLTVKRNYSIISAPFDGVVSKKYTEVGELLLPGKQIVTIVNPDKIYVLATIDEVDVGRLRLNQPVTITVDALQVKIRRHDQTHISHRERRQVSRPVPLTCGSTLQKDMRIKPGMSADVEILVATLHNVLSVPSQAVIEREGKNRSTRSSERTSDPGQRRLSGSIRSR
jgi:HlyD family secretion protein